nr:MULTISPECIES: D-alanyl-D-alanine carboxypeptidase family protein [unclassified Jannaschia]
MVMDARTGEVLRSRNADTRLHPASLTKMMTLYIAFEAVRKGEITLDTQVRISRHAASEPPSKLGLRAGQKIALRYLIRAAAVKSANDAATAIGEAISGSEEAFTARMNRTARALGMTSTTFRNAHGLTQSGHLSTARDMTVMGRRLFYDYPQYYNLFSRRTTDAGVASVRNTNRRLLDAYRGADGIKTGYTNAAGFNLVASAVRGEERVIATVFGGRSTATRNARIAELLDMGFERAPSRVVERRPSLPTYGGATVPGPTAPAISARPVARGTPQVGDVLVANASAPATGAAPAPRPVQTLGQVAEAPLEVVTRASTSGGRTYSISLRRQATRSAADKLLLRTALQELDTLDDALRQVQAVRGGYDPSFVGLSEREANRACTRLRARDVECDVLIGS